MFAARTKVNQQQLRYFAAGICGLMGVFIIFHWTRYVFNKPAFRGSNITYPVRVISRQVSRDGYQYRSLLTMRKECEKATGSKGPLFSLEWPCPPRRGLPSHQPFLNVHEH